MMNFVKKNKTENISQKKKSNCMRLTVRMRSAPPHSADLVDLRFFGILSINFDQISALSGSCLLPLFQKSSQFLCAFFENHYDKKQG